MENNSKILGKRILSSLSISTIFSYFDVKEVIQFQSLSKYLYQTGVPRSIFECPTIYLQICAFDETYQNLTVYDPEIQMVQRYPLNNDFRSEFLKGIDIYSINTTQMPNGKFYIVVSLQKKSGNRELMILSLSNKDMIIKKEYTATKIFHINGAVTSSINSIFVSGSQVGKTKSCSLVRFQSDQVIVKNLPELQFGRYNHSMTIKNQRYLYVFGGTFTQDHIYSNSPIIERLDLTRGKQWHIIHLQFRHQLHHITTNLNYTCLVPFNQNEILIFGKDQATQMPVSIMFEEDTQLCRNLQFFNIDQRYIPIATQMRFLGSQPLIFNGLQQGHQDMYLFDQRVAYLIRLSIKGQNVRSSIISTADSQKILFNRTKGE
ncbi:macronuclear development protein 3 [Stylonychia lemnae]|uniref:Macronuclear development protein 3 n=1 Tax=Stylonychia lemnae TaxID=5949 RepID=A0A078ACZ8_STYLE|nr:macronuclear development protein 3 [Stylonychia lemnae]|eukprot:CDW78733.1 macronuclear development protein 3 [Stylonychia lemnae]